MVAPILQGPISELTRRYEEAGRDARGKRRERRQTTGRELREFYRDTYDWLANQSTPEVTGPLVVGMRMAPKLVAPLYLGAKLGKLVGTAGAEGYFGSGPVAGLEYTPEIAEYERSALRTSRII